MSKLGGRCICKFCDFENTGTCIIEAAKTGHYGIQPTDVQQLKAEIALAVKEFESIPVGYRGNQMYKLLDKLRQLSAV
jgi:hypothetical protein